MDPISPTAEQAVRQAPPVHRVASPPAASFDSRKIFVAGFKPSVTSQGLQNQFSRFGRVVDAKVIMNRQTGSSRRCGFVTFDSPGPVQAVLAERNVEVCGDVVTVEKFQTKHRNTSTHTPSTPKTNKPCPPITEEFEASNVVLNKNGNPPISSDITVTDETIRCVYVGHLRPEVTRAHLMEYFCKFGKIERVFVFKRNVSRASLGFGFVYFAKASAAQKVLNSGPHRIGTSELLIRCISKDELQMDSNYGR
ncbi:unnamed protein product [Dibothriocephalus latus]|uniref:RRM domain-containing protein n=1 Tax=Dibothriocephalus latus TaxID=60516 RepID=A0A3P7PFD1_DIBLA|nr:unnamed protein product [Dibothriocephalus latus]